MDGGTGDWKSGRRAAVFCRALSVPVHLLPAGSYPLLWGCSGSVTTRATTATFHAKPLSDGLLSRPPKHQTLQPETSLTVSLPSLPPQMACALRSRLWVVRPLPLPAALRLLRLLPARSRLQSAAGGTSAQCACWLETCCAAR